MIQDARARIRNLIGGEDKLSKSEPNLLIPRTDEYPTSPTEGKNEVLSSDTLDSGIFDDVIIDVADLAEDRNRLESQLERMQELHDENDTLKAEYAQDCLNICSLNSGNLRILPQGGFYPSESISKPQNAIS